MQHFSPTLAFIRVNAPPDLFVITAVSMSGVSQTLLYHNGCNDPSFQLCVTFPAQSHYTLIQQREIQAGAAAVFLTTEAAESTSH